MPNSLKSHIETLREMLESYDAPAWTVERAALTAAIEALSRAPIAEGGDEVVAFLRELRADYLITSDKGRLLDAAIESLSRQGGEYDRELIVKMLADYAYPDPLSPRHYATDAIRKQAELLIAADNRDAAGVRTVRRASEAGGCVWTVDGDGTWETACGEVWQFTCDGPEENNFRFCHGCGKPVAIAAAPAPGGGS